MNLSFYIAKRYLFSKKSQNAINLISTVAVCGIAVATIAMVCALSVLNGFQGLVAGMFNSFDPELKITSVKGKVFDLQSEEILQLKKMPEIALFSPVLEDNVLIKYKDRQVPATLKGVSDNYNQLAQIDSTLIDGECFKLADEVNSYGTLGVGLASKLGLNAGFVFPIEIYAPKRNAEINLSNASASSNLEYIYIGGVFMINQPVYDDNLIIVPVELASSLFEYEDQASSIELKVKEGHAIGVVQNAIKKELGDGYFVKNRYEQQEASFKMMSIEKWVIYLILIFILVIAVFNVIGSLSMLIIEKQQDILILRNMGASNKLISRIFLFEGWMISVIGAVVGIFAGLLLCLGQLYFGWIKMGDSGTFVVDFYPVTVIFSDVILIFASVVTIGFLTALYPVKYFTKTKNNPH